MFMIVGWYTEILKCWYTVDNLSSWFTDLPKCVEDHGEEDKLAKEGDDERGGWDDLGQQEEEHGQGEQDGDG